MASFEDFLDLAGRARAPAVVRASLQRVRRLRPDDAERWHRARILAGVALAHLLLALMLREAMRPSVQVEGPDDHLLVTFIVPVRPAPPAAPAIAQPAPSVPRPAQASPATRAPQRLARHPQPAAAEPGALHAVEVPPPARTFAPPGASKPAADTPAPSLTLYGPDGRLRVPPDPVESKPRDLLKRRSVSWMLPGAPRPDSPDFHVRPGKSPRDYVNGAGKVIAALIGGVAQRPDGNGLMPATADRGVRTSNRDSGPCEDIAIDLADVDPDHAKSREQAEQRWEQSCEDR